MLKRTLSKAVSIGLLAVAASPGLSLIVEGDMQAEYEKIISNTAVVSACLDNDLEMLAKYAEENGWHYQWVQDGVVVSASSDIMPHYPILSVHNPVQPGVLFQEPYELLAHVKPLHDLIDGRRYMIVPLFSAASSDGDGCILYTEIIG